MHYLRDGLADIGLKKLGSVLAIVFTVVCMGGSFGDRLAQIPSQGPELAFESRPAIPQVAAGGRTHPAVEGGARRPGCPDSSVELGLLRRRQIVGTRVALSKGRQALLRFDEGLLSAPHLQRRALSVLPRQRRRKRMSLPTSASKDCAASRRKQHSARRRSRLAIH